MSGAEREARQPGDPTVTEIRKASSATRMRYHESYSLLTKWSVKNRMSFGSHDLVDDALAEYSEVLFFEGHGVEKMETVFAGTLWRNPLLRRQPGGGLPRSRAAIGGRKKIHPPQTRRPLPRGVVALHCRGLVKAGRSRFAVGVWMAMEMYLRPGEWLGVRMRNLQRPDPSLEAGGRHWIHHLHPEEEGVSLKTKEFDTAIPLDLDRHKYLSAFLADLKRDRPGSEAAWSCTCALVLIRFWPGILFCPCPRS